MQKMQNNYIFYHFQNHIDFENIRATARLFSHKLLRSYRNSSKIGNEHNLFQLRRNIRTMLAKKFLPSGSFAPIK